MDIVDGKMAEYAVIGAVLRYPDADLLEQILATTDIEYFDTAECRAVRMALEQINPDAYDPSTIKLKLLENGHLDDPVSTEFLEKAFHAAPLPVTLPEHIQALKVYAAQRKAYSEANSLTNRLQSAQGNAGSLSQAVDESIEHLSDIMMHVGHHEWTTIGAASEDLLNKDHSGPSETIPTGLSTLDEVLNGGGGLGLGQLITLAARPGFGKSSLALDFVRHAILEGIPTALFSIEMSQEENVARLLGSTASINHTAIRNGNYTPREKETLNYWHGKIKEAPLYLDTRAELTINDLFSTYHRMNADSKAKNDKPIQLVVIDYLQLLESSQKFESREKQIAYYSRKLKAFAQKQKVAVLTLAQLNRGGKNSDVEHRPNVKDLRESGAIEQDSDIVLLLAQPEEEEELQAPKGRMTLIIGKHRNGELKDIPLTFIPHYPRFEVRDEDDEDEITGSGSISDW